MNYVIIEDEISAQWLLKNRVEELKPDWQLQATLDSVENAVDWFKKNHIRKLCLWTFSYPMERVLKY